MIRFIDGDVDATKSNCSVTVKGPLGTKDIEEYKGIAKRTDDDLEIIVDFNALDDGTPITICLHDENNATFHGKWKVEDIKESGSEPGDSDETRTEYTFVQ